MKEEQNRLTVRMTQGTFKLLKKLATKEEKSLSVYVRDLIERQLSVEKTKQDEDLIRTYIRAELEPLLNSFANRIIKISAKGSATSASSWLLLARTLEHFVDEEFQDEFNEVVTESRKAGQVYLAQRDSKLEEFFENNF